MNPLVSIIITTWAPEQKRYLDLCVESVKNLNFPQDQLDITIIGRKGYMPEYEGIHTKRPDEDGHFYPARGINYGMLAANPRSKYFLILNDDVILTKNSLANLVSAVGDHKIMANGISPCDNGIAYNLLFGFQKDNEFIGMSTKQYRYDDLKGYFKELMNAESIYPQGIVRQGFLCIYATLIPRIAYEAIGDWDENFKTGQDDLDYSMRAHQKGFDTVSVLNSLIWHFSGVTVENTLNLKIRQDNVRYFRDKWGHMPPGIRESFLD